MATEQAGQRAPDPAAVHPGEIGLGKQRLGAMAQPPVGRQERALPLPLAGRVAQSAARHRQLQRAQRRDQPPRPPSMAMTLGQVVALVAAPAERRRQLLLQQLLDERPHLAARRLLQGIEPLLSGERRWRRGRGRRSFPHGVGSLSVWTTGTYAASIISHQPRDTTFPAHSHHSLPGPKKRLTLYMMFDI
jgi:hypothetical protein